MKKKLGPLPVWAWAAIGAGIVIFIYYRSKSSSSSSSSGQNAVDPNNPLGLTYAQENADISQGIDPNTGQTYASEQAAADQSQTSGGGGSTGGGGTDNTAALGQLDTDLNNGFATLSTQLAGGQGLTDQTSPGQAFLGEVQDVTGAFGALGINLGVTTPATNATGSTPATAGSGGGSITTHQGGPFYNFYVAVTGHAPPTTVSTSNLIYAAWKAGKTVAQAKTISGSGSGAAGSSGRGTVRTSVANRSAGSAGKAVSSGGKKLTSGKRN